MTQPIGPQVPVITFKQLLRQFRFDVYGKEVQDATTYSYVWLADQMGHVCLGIVLNFLFTAVAGWLLIDDLGVKFVGLIAATVIVCGWEVWAYLGSAKNAKGLFPLDERLLRFNAFTAAFYMVLGAIIGFVFQQTQFVLGFAIVVAVGVIFAPWWVRQKMIWQKAALPYLFRLADAKRSITQQDAKALQGLIDKGAPPDSPPRQIVIGGPIGSGRTPMAAGIGTEFAFKKAMVRYVSLGNLMEFAVQTPKPDYADDSGPANVGYWRWSQAQVLIIDDVGPLIAAMALTGPVDPVQFEAMLKSKLGAIAGLLALCHTVWVMGDLDANGQTAIAGQTLDDFARAIRRFCQGKEEALVIELSSAAGGIPGSAKLRAV